MATKNCFLPALLLVLGTVASNVAAAVPSHINVASLNRSSFPGGFIFGTASSASQYEGAAAKGGRGPSIWDFYTHRYPGKIKDGSNGDVAIDSYHRYKEDVGIMKEMDLDAYRFSISWSRILPSKIKDGSNGDVAIDSYHRYKEDVGIMKEMDLDAYRFSISWSRILPNGKLSGGVNREGIQYYNNLINELLANGIQPFVTLFHWDLPHTLEDEYGGFLSPRIVKDYEDYAEICFKEFGDRVKYWITLNEPWTYSMGGYAAGLLAPGRCSDWQGLNCAGGDSATEPYLAAHYQLLAHARAVHLYKKKYQKTQKGVIGITLISQWFVPFSDAKHDQNAAKRALDFMLGWFMDPLTNGDYPHTMRSLVGDRLPKFSREQSEMIKGSFDFLGLNYYTTNYAAYTPHSNSRNASYLTDSRANLSTERHGVLIGPKAASDWLYIYPRGIRDLLLYVKREYRNPLIYITENGVDEFNNGSLTLKEALVDTMRVDYYYHHLDFLRRSIKDGVNVKGYFAWSLLDNFEWYAGYTVRFGINYVDYKDGLKRYPKLSAHWFKSFLKK